MPSAGRPSDDLLGGKAVTRQHSHHSQLQFVALLWQRGLDQQAARGTDPWLQVVRGPTMEAVHMHTQRSGLQMMSGYTDKQQQLIKQHISQHCNEN